MGTKPTGLSVENDDVRFKNALLFENIPNEKRCSVLRCLNASSREYSEGESLLSGVAMKTSRYLVSGTALVVRLDENGNRSILCVLKENAVIAGELSAGLFKQEDIDIIAVGPCLVLDFGFTAEVEARACCMKHINTVKGNLISALNSTSVLLLGHMTVLSCRTIREKVLAYLTLLAQQQGSNEVTMLFNKQDLADFLQVNRSALSRELSKLKAEGVIDYDKKKFKIL